MPLNLSADPDQPFLDDRRLRAVLRRATIVLLLALGGPALALLALVLVLLISAHWVDQTDQVIARTNGLQRQLFEMQSSFRGYRLSGNEALLQTFDRVRQANSQTWNDLISEVADNPGQVAQVNASRTAAGQWIAFVDAELAEVRGVPALIGNSAFLARGVPLFDRALRRLDKVSAEESRLRDKQDRTLRQVVTALLSTLAVIALIGIPVLLFWLRRLIRRVSATFRAHAEVAERRAQELSVTLHSIGDAVIATDAHGLVSFLNPTAVRLMGWSNEEAAGRELVDVFPIFNEDTLLPVENPVERVLREHRTVGLANHTVLRTRDGRELPIEDSAAPIQGEDGTILGVILVFHDVTDKRSSERALRESESRFRFLSELGDACRLVTEPGAIMSATTRLLGERLGASRCAYAEVEDNGTSFTILEDYTDGCASSAGQYQLSLFGPRAHAQMQGGDTLTVRDVAQEVPTGQGREMFEAIGIRALIACPLIKDGQLRAMMAVHQIAARDWTEADVALVEEVVERCWSHIERARAEKETMERSRLSTLRADIAGQLDLAKPIAETLQGCCECVVQHLDAAFARIWTVDRAENVLLLQASAGIYTHLDGPHGRVPVGQFKIGRIAESRQPHLTNDVQNDPQVSDQDWARRESMRAFAGYPLLVEGKILGVLAVFSRHPLSEAALSDLAPISDAIAQQIQRKYAETALQSSENLKTAILATSLDGFIVMDHEGRVLDWNPAAEAIVGYTRAEAIGQLLGDLIVPEALRERHRQGLKRYVETREVHILGRRLELPAIRRDGSEFPSEVSITHILGTEPPLFAGYLRDISSRKADEAALIAATERAEADARALAEGAERFHLLSEVVALQVWTAGPDGGLDFVNSEVISYLGGDPDKDILGEAWTHYVHPDDLAAAARLWQQSLSEGSPYAAEMRLRRTDGEYHWFLVRAEALKGDAGEVTKWFGTNTDINDLKLAQAETERASRAKDDFMAVLSHELRTPLTPVLMAAASLREDERLPPDVRSQLAMMERNIGLEARLIDDLLDITRIAKGKLPLRPQLCDAHSLISLAIEIVRDEALSKGISLNQNFDAECSGLHADPSRFQQVIWNLLRNAVKFTPPSGSIAIQTRDGTGEDGKPILSIEVCDSGIGIDAEAIDRIFQPFEQVGLTGDHRFGGIGLGLAIARAIVDLHGGTIRAESDGPDLGSRFIVELPGATNPPPGMVESPENAETFLKGAVSAAPEEKPDAPQLDLLLVEDHAPTLLVLERLLKRAGHLVATASSVASALTLADQHQFDLVISDLGLPDGTGNELMEKLRDRHGLRGIALTGYGMEEDMERSRQAGFMIHLIKPIEFNQLRRALATFQSGDAESNPAS